MRLPAALLVALFCIALAPAVKADRLVPRTIIALYNGGDTK